MKNILIISILIFSVIILNAQEKKSRKQKRTEKEAMLVEQTKKLVESKAWQFDATQMLPAIGRSQVLTDPYSVTLENEEVDSYLPFFGRAYSAEYGGTDSPMVFKALIENYSAEDSKKGSFIIKFRAKNKNDMVEFTFTIMPNGSTTLSVNSTNRQHISYHGDLVPIEETKE